MFLLYHNDVATLYFIKDTNVQKLVVLIYSKKNKQLFSNFLLIIGIFVAAKQNINFVHYILSEFRFGFLFFLNLFSIFFYFAFDLQS